MDNNLGIGIDIGASKIVVAICRGQQAEIVLNGEGRRSTQFCLAFNNRERLFGVAAEGQYPVNSENTIYGRDVKQVIGLRNEDLKSVSSPLRIYNGDNENIKYEIQYKNQSTKLHPEHILTMMLRKIKKEMESAYKTKVTTAVITVPSMFNSAQRFAVKNAVLAAEIEVQSIINDSTATAITYSIDRHGSDDKKILVFDMGANSIDVAVVQLSGNSVEVKACGGSLNLGGDNFVSRLIQHFLQEFEKKKGVSIIDDKLILARLRIACEEFKKMLSATNDANMIIELFYQREPYQLKMTRNTFESICHDLFNEIVDTIEEVLTKSGISKTDIDEIIVVGNGGRIPKLQDMMSELFKRNLSKVLNYDESIATGAAFFAARNMSDASYRIRRLDVKEVTATALKVSIEAFGTFVLIKTGQPMGNNGAVTIEPESSVVLHFKQGDYEFLQQWLRKTDFETLVNIDGNGLVKFSVQCSENLPILLNHQKPNVTKIKEILKEEECFEKDELDYKRAMEMKNNLEKLCLDTKRSLKKNETNTLMPVKDVENLQTACQKILDFLDDTPYPEINKLIKLKEYLQTISDKFFKQVQYREKLDHANLLIEQKNYKEADSIYEHAINAFEKYINKEEMIDLMFKRVSALMKIEDFRKSINLLDTLIYSFDENDDDLILVALQKRGFCHFQLKNYVECISDLNTVLKHNEIQETRDLRNRAKIELNSEKVEKLFQQVEKLMKHRQFDEADMILKEIWFSDEFVFLLSNGIDFRFKIYLMKAQNNFKMGNYNFVIQDCKFAEEFTENKTEIWELRAMANIELQNFYDAEFDITLIESLEKFNKDRLNDLKRKLEGKRYQNLKAEYDKLISNKQYQQALNVLEQNNVNNLEKVHKTDYFCKQASAFLRLEKYTESAEACGRALNIDKKYTRALEIRAECYFNMKEYKKAIDECNFIYKHANGWPYHIRQIKEEAEKSMNEKKGRLERLKNSVTATVSNFFGDKQKEETPCELEKEIDKLAPKNDDSSEKDNSWEKKKYPHYMQDTQASSKKKNEKFENPRQSERLKEKNKKSDNHFSENMEVDEVDLTQEARPKYY